MSSPGGFAAGIVGVICVLLALYALGTINANWTGLGFVLLSLVLFVLDIKAPTHGALTVGGVASLIFGLYLLYNTSDVSVPWGSILLSGVLTGAFFVFAVGKAVAIQHRPPVTGMTSMVGLRGVVRQPLEPRGFVLVNGEFWEAESESGALRTTNRRRHPPEGLSASGSTSLARNRAQLSSRIGPDLCPGLEQAGTLHVT